MKFGEMSGWTKRLKEIRNIKDPVLRGKRLKNMWCDFLIASGDRVSTDPIHSRMYETLKQELSTIN